MSFVDADDVANDDYNEVEIDAEPRRLDINPDTVLAAAEQSIVQVQTCEQCLTMFKALVLLVVGIFYKAKAIFVCKFCDNPQE